MAQTAHQRSWLDRLWTGIADQGRAFARVPAPGVTGAERARQLTRALLSERGEASGAALAREVIMCFRALTMDQRMEVLRGISEDFSPDPDALRQAAEAYLAAPGAEPAQRLHDAAEPPRQELLRRMNMAAGGTAMLVEMRRELLAVLPREPALRPLNRDLLHLFGSWFNRGFLELRRIDWETPASILEKLITYEAVHEISGWQDLRRRLLPDRRCFAFFHQALPNDPLIFVEVALTHGLAGAVQPLLAPPRDEAGLPPKHMDTAIFYSISNCQDGLRGISFGNFLIKQVVEDLKAELPAIKHFATLSPVPGFSAWLARQPAAALPFSADERAALGLDDTAAGAQWWQNEALSQSLRGKLLHLAALYLTQPASAQFSMDPVARFHLGNGARLERIHWMGDTAPRGLRQSFGIMVNYLYDPRTIEANHETFVNTGQVARSAEVDGLIDSKAA